MSMISRIGAVGCLLLSGCSLTPSVSHGPVTEETLRRLDERAISKDQLFAGLATGAIRTDLSGHHENVVIPLHLVNGTPRIDVGINGGAAQMLLDSGAARTMIEASVAVKNKVTLLRAEDATVSMRGVIGNEEGRLGVLSPLKIGPWELHGYPCIVRTHQNTVRTGLGSTKVESSLLGFDIPSRFCTYLTIDYRTSKPV